MNREVIERLGDLHPPAARHARSFTSSIALNMFRGEGGSIYALCEDGQIRYMDIGRSHNTSERSKMSTLKLDASESLLIDMDFSGLEFNFSGSVLLVWGASCLGVAVLPAEHQHHPLSAEEEDAGAACQFVMLYKSQGHREDIAKAMWHPLSDKHVVVLLRTNKLLMFDVVEGTESEYLLDPSKTYSSFCFGPSLDWMSLSVFLLDSGADITCLCPLLPTGAVVPTDTIRDLHEWLSDSLVEKTSRSYRRLVDEYLRAAFGGDDEGGGPRQQLRRAGLFRGRPLGEQHAPLHESFYRQPLLQGPLAVEGRLKKRGRSGSTALPCDICAPSTAGEEAALAVLLVSWSDGVVEQFVLGAAFGPSWSSDSTRVGNESLGGEESLCFGSPSLVHVETLCLAMEGQGQGARDSFYSLKGDPLSKANFHVTARHSAQCFLLRLNWIEQAAAESEKTSSSASSSLLESSAHLLFRHPRAQQALSGQVLVSDPQFGHVAIMRGSDGYMAAVNLRVEEKIMALDWQTRVS